MRTVVRLDQEIALRRAQSLEEQNAELRSTLLEVKRTLEDSRPGDALKIVRAATRQAAPASTAVPGGHAA